MGILLWFLGVFVIYAVPQLITAFYVAKDGPAIVVNYQPTLIAGYSALVLGLIFVLVGVSRAAAGIDYLVSVAREPVSRPQRRATEDLFSEH